MKGAIFQTALIVFFKVSLRKANAKIRSLANLA